MGNRASVTACFCPPNLVENSLNEEFFEHESLYMAVGPPGNRERLDSLESNRQNTKFCAKPILQNVDYARATPSFFLLYCETVLVSSTLVVATVVQQFAQHYEFEYCPPGYCIEIFQSIFAVFCLADALPLLENQCCHTKDHSRPFVQNSSTRLQLDFVIYNANSS